MVRIPADGTTLPTLPWQRPGTGCLPSLDYGSAPGSTPGRGAPPEGRAADGQSPSRWRPDLPGHETDALYVQSGSGGLGPYYCDCSLRDGSSDWKQGRDDQPIAAPAGSGGHARLAAISTFPQPARRGSRASRGCRRRPAEAERTAPSTAVADGAPFPTSGALKAQRVPQSWDMAGDRGTVGRRGATNQATPTFKGERTK